MIYLARLLVRVMIISWVLCNKICPAMAQGTLKQMAKDMEERK